MAVFKSLKDNFSKTVRALSFTKKNFIVTKKEFSRVVKSPFEKAFSILNIKAGFQKCGIYPFNPDVVPKSKMDPSNVHRSLLSPSATDLSDEMSTPNPPSSGPSAGPLSSSPGPSSSSPGPSSSPPGPSNSSPGLSSLSPGPTSSIPRTSCTSDNATGVLDSDHAMSQAIFTLHRVDLQVSLLFHYLSSPPSATGTVASNPLVDCGLISPDLADILATPSMDAAVVQRHVKRIRGARDLTAEDYVEMLREDKRRRKR